MVQHRQERQKSKDKLKAAMSVAATLCVLGLAGMMWLHDPDARSVERRAGSFAAPVSAATTLPASGIPSAAKAFEGRKYEGPEEPIAQF
jgi:hypothetical protein